MKVEFLNDLTLNEIFILIGVSAVFGVMAHIAFEYLCDVYRLVKQKRSEKLGNQIVSDEFKTTEQIFAELYEKEKAKNPNFSDQWNPDYFTLKGVQDYKDQNPSARDSVSKKVNEGEPDFVNLRRMAEAQKDLENSVNKKHNG